MLLMPDISMTGTGSIVAGVTFEGSGTREAEKEAYF